MNFALIPAETWDELEKLQTAYKAQIGQVRSLSVGCADCDVGMYKPIGFNIPLGNLLAFGN